jgi:hypothetical protein
MIRYILFPGAIIMLCGIGGMGYFLWDVFHFQFQSNWNVTQAYDGDLAAERHLALCYKTGCTNVPRDPAFACAWRQIIATDAQHLSLADMSAEHLACGRFSGTSLKLVRTLKNDIRMKMLAQKNGRPEKDRRSGAKI